MPLKLVPEVDIPPVVRPYWTSPNGIWQMLWFNEDITGGLRVVRSQYAEKVKADIWRRFRVGECSNLEERQKSFGKDIESHFHLDLGGSVCLDNLVPLDIVTLDGMGFSVWNQHLFSASYLVACVTKHATTGLFHIRTEHRTFVFDAEDLAHFSAGLARLCREYKSESEPDDSGGMVMDVQHRVSTHG